MKTILFVALLLVPGLSFAQCTPGGLSLTEKASVDFGLPKQAMTMTHDVNGKPYLYVAGKERGLVVYNISNIAAPYKADSVPVTALNNMEVMNVYASGNYVYLSLGNTFNNNEKPGMAIIDVSNPDDVQLKDVWVHTMASGGAGIVKVAGNFAYLGAMREGLILLDISDKSNISFYSQFKPNINYPNPNSPDPLKYNARGMEIRGNQVFLCYDAGGIRVIDFTNKLTPNEIARYSNPAILNRPRAYNNIILDDTLAFVAVDYCGMEVLNISNLGNITQIGWWNPWQCQNPSANNWFNSPGHTNEIRYNANCKLLFMSSGKSELDIVSVKNPASPVLCDSFGNTTNTMGTWGVGLYLDQLYLSYIYVPLGIPFYSNWSGIKIINWDYSCNTAIANALETHHFTIYPNPTNGNTTLEFDTYLNNPIVNVYSVLGEKIYSKTFDGVFKSIDIQLNKLVSGNYFVNIQTSDYTANKVLVINH